jgi:hypothetical protein
MIAHPFLDNMTVGCYQGIFYIAHHSGASDTPKVDTHAVIFESTPPIPLLLSHHSRPDDGPTLIRGIDVFLGSSK